MLLNAVFYALILLFVIMLLSLWYKHCYVRLPRRLVVIRKVLIIEKIINKQIEVMIHTVPNPKMTTREVDKFREDFRKCVSGKFSYISKFHIIISCKSIVYIVMCFYQETN